MPRNVNVDDELEMPEFENAGREEIPEIPAPRKTTARKKGSYPRAVPKEFDLRAAHLAWKEKYGIEDDNEIW